MWRDTALAEARRRKLRSDKGKAVRVHLQNLELLFLPLVSASLNPRPELTYCGNPDHSTPPFE